MKIDCTKCGWSWSTKDSEEFDKYVCHKCNNDMTDKYTVKESILRLLRENFDLAVKKNYL
jgi:transposase-like protein